MKRYFGYEGKTCVVTGASSGMGKATVELLVEFGAKVYALDMNECTVEGIIDFVQVDLSDKESIDLAMTKLPEQINYYFGVAGLSGFKTDYQTTFNVNFTSNKYITERYLKSKMKFGDAILFVSSTAGHNWFQKEMMNEIEPIVNANSWENTISELTSVSDKNTPGGMAYIASKRCICLYSAKLSCELGKSGIRVNTVLPGSSDTGMKDEFEVMVGGSEALVKNSGMAGRLATSHEMANTIVFLNSNMASFISGIDLYVDYSDNAMKLLGLKQDDVNISIKIN